MTVLLQLDRVGKVFDGGAGIVGLREVDLRIDVGDHVAVTGPSGAGKSTLLNILAMLDRPTSGTYTFDGIDVGRLPDQERTTLRGRRVGLVFQAFHLLGHLTATENVALGGLYLEPSPRRRREEARALLDRVGLTRRRDERAATLSGGERQRVAIARAMMGQRPLLLCDEPTGNLDQANAAQMLDLLQELHTGGTTVVVVTHDPATADRAPRRIHVLDGRVTGTSS